MPKQISLHMNLPCTDKKGFTLIELIIVILIIGILATIAIMQVLDFRERSYNATLQSDLRSAYTASMQFHIDYPEDDVAVPDLIEYDFMKSEDVVIEIVDGSETGLIITAKHPGTRSDFKVDHAGRVSEL